MLLRRATYSGGHQRTGHPAVRQALSRDVLGEKTPVSVRREWQWLGPGPGGGPLEGIIDRVVIAGGHGSAERALIIDWKTDRVASGDEIIHAESYRSQLEAYREAACQLTGLAGDRVAVVLVFVRNGILVPLES